MEQQQISQMLEDVRKAHRLIYLYQDSILSIIKEIHKTYDFPRYPTVRKLFSHPLRTTETFNGTTTNKNKAVKLDEVFQAHKNANLRCQEKWAWDFIYTYELEYYFGMKKSGNQRCLFSVFQVTDNGYYMRDGYNKEHELPKASPTHVDDFWTANEAKSYLIFVAECSSNATPSYFPHHRNQILPLYGGNENIITIKEEIPNTTLIAQRFPIEQFFDKEGVQSCLDTFAGTLYKETQFKIK